MTTPAHTPEYTLAQKSGDLLASKNTKIEEQQAVISDLLNTLEKITLMCHDSNAINDNQARYDAFKVASGALKQHTGIEHVLRSDLVDVITWDEDWRPVVNKVKKLKPA